MFLHTLAKLVGQSTADVGGVVVLETVVVAVVVGETKNSHVGPKNPFAPLKKFNYIIFSFINHALHTVTKSLSCTQLYANTTI